MRYWLLLAVPCVLWLPLGCDNGGGDGDGDADADVGCGEIGQACNESTDCPALQVCHEHRCGCAYNRDYEIEIIQAAVYARAPGGHCWEDDPPECADDPDVYTVMQVGDTTYTTSTKDDTLNPIWNETFVVYVDERTEYGVWIYDADPGETSDDVVLEFDISWHFFFTEENLRNAWIYLEAGDPGAQTRLDFILTPQ